MVKAGIQPNYNESRVLMEMLVADVPLMYGDHHVSEVRRLLLALPGVAEVYASSYLKTVEVSFDPTQIDSAAIMAALDEAGYLQELEFPQETGIAAYNHSEGNSTFFRHTTAYAQTGKTVSFAQQVAPSQRPLIPCPGMDRQKEMDE